MPKHCPPRVPSQNTPLRRWLGLAIIRALRWRIEGTIPNLSQGILVAGPHTSLWDGVLGFAAIHALRLRVTVLVADKYFSRLSHPLLLAIGAQPVNRSQQSGVVEQAIDRFATNEKMALLLTPENTRLRCPQLRTGFHEIARRANVPIIPLALDYQRRTIVIGPPMAAGQTAEQSVQVFCEFMAKSGRAKHPDRLSLPLRAYNKAHQGSD